MKINERGYKIKGPHWNALYCYSNGDLWSKFIPRPDTEGLRLPVKLQEKLPFQRTAVFVVFKTISLTESNNKR